MELKEYLDYLNAGNTVVGGSDYHQYMTYLSNEAMKITMELNNKYHTPDEIRELMSQLIGKPVPDSFHMFPPFYTDCGKNITLEEGAFINSSCHFQDQGGITIGAGAQIGHNVVIATINHSFAPGERLDMIPGPVVVGKNAWIGSNSTITPNVTIGENAVVGAGSVVTKDVPANTVVAGVPAKVIRKIEE